MNEWRKFRKTQISEMREPLPEDDNKLISVNNEDLNEWNGDRNGKVARNPENYNDQWYMSKAFFEANYEEIEQ